MRENIVAGKAFYFALKVIDLYQEMRRNKEYVISNQLLRCATSIGANIEEAGAACSKKDFVLKMTIASKEARETRYWLRLLKESQIIEGQDMTPLLLEIDEIIRLLTKIVKTIQTENK